MTQPSEASVEAAQEAIVEEMAFFDDWPDRYRYLIDLGRRLPPFPEAQRTEANRIQGCQSQVWMHSELRDDGGLAINATSDAAIVSGLIALLLRVYGGRAPAEILTTRPEFVARTGLSGYLSPTRSNGLAAMLDAIYAAARAQQRAG